VDLILLTVGDTSFSGGFSSTEGAKENSDKIFDGSIELVSMHFGMKQQITTDVSNVARAQGRPDFSDITLVRYTDKSSIFFYEACLMEKPIGSGDDVSRISVLRKEYDNDRANILFTIELTNAMVAEIETQSHPNDMTTEQIKLNFTNIKWNYHSPQSDASFSWSLAENRPS
jgi:type VI secretion system secreted protein Hcp